MSNDVWEQHCLITGASSIPVGVPCIHGVIVTDPSSLVN